MDISEKYILMCSKATEIQEKYNLSHKGDWFCHVTNIIIVCNKDTTQKAGVWLPRQDQLQEIYKEDKQFSIYQLSLRVHVLAKDTTMAGVMSEQFQKDFGEITFEKLWLIAIMQDNYSKEWSEEKRDWTNV